MSKYEYSSWRHGGWYVHNVRYPSGACGCVSNNYEDKRWRIACDPRPFDERPTFSTRHDAAGAEMSLVYGMKNPPTSEQPAPSSDLSAIPPTLLVRLIDFADNADIDGRDVDQLRDAIRTELSGLAIPSAADLRKSRLSDAAEDMLAALRTLTETMQEALYTHIVDLDNGDDEPDENDGYVKAIRAGQAAIAKATGDEPESAILSELDEYIAELKADHEEATRRPVAVDLPAMLATAAVQWAEAFEEIAQLVDGQELTILDDKVIPLIGNIDFAKLAQLLRGLAGAKAGPSRAALYAASDYLTIDARKHFKTHGDWCCDAGKLMTALDQG